MKKEIIEKIQNKKFGLKDLERTKEKYKNYKKQETYIFFRDYKDELKENLKNLHGRVFSELNYLENSYLGVFQKPLSKSMINRISTYINNITKDINKNIIHCKKDMNSNAIRVYSILFYLRNYNKINKIMSNVLKEYLKDYDKKLIIKNL